MAKKRKEKTEEEELDFKIPKFDEEKFLTKERRNIKTTFISFLFGILMAFICFGFWALLHGNSLRWTLVLLVGLINASFIRYLFIRLKIDLTDFGRKGWFTSYSIYIFTWLLVLIVLVNPPFYDDEAPRMEIVTLPGMQELGGTVKIVGFISDNVNIESMDFTITDPMGNTSNINDYTYENLILTYEYQNTNNMKGEFNYKITAADPNKYTSVYEGKFTYEDNVIVLTSPQENTLLNYYTPITFRVKEDVFEPIKFNLGSNENYMDFRVYYKVNDGVSINVSRLNEDDRAEYRTTPEYKGWTQNSNVTIKPYVEVSHYFLNINQKYSNTITDSNSYNFSTASDLDIGEKDILVAPNPYYKLGDENQYKNTLNYYLPFFQQHLVPGFELLVFVISLIGVVLIFKYRKRSGSKK